MGKPKNGKSEAPDEALVKSNISIPGLAQVDVPKERVDRGIDSEDIVVPRIKLLQPTSAEVTDQVAHAGAFLNSVTNEVLPEELHVLIFTHFKSRVYFAKPEDGGGVKCISPDGIEGSEYGVCANCNFRLWKEGTPPACALVHNYPAYVLNAGEIKGEPLPIALSLMKTSSKEARKLNTAVEVGGGNWFDAVYVVRSEKQTNDKGTFFVYRIEKLRAASDDERKLGYWAYSRFKGRLDVEAPESITPAGAPAVAPAGAPAGAPATAPKDLPF